MEDKNDEPTLFVTDKGTSLDISQAIMSNTPSKLVNICRVRKMQGKGLFAGKRP